MFTLYPKPRVHIHNPPSNGYEAALSPGIISLIWQFGTDYSVRTSEYFPRVGKTLPTYIIYRGPKLCNFKEFKRARYFNHDKVRVL